MKRARSIAGFLLLVAATAVCFYLLLHAGH